MTDQNPRRGIALTVVAMFCLAGMDATGKILTQTYSIVEIMAIRFGLFFGVAIFAAIRSGRLGRLRSRLAAAQIFRSLVLVIEVSVFIYSFHLMPLADVHAIAAIAPLVATLFAGRFLRESLDRRTWQSVAIGFLGAVIIIRPGLGVMSGQAVIPILGALLWAIYQVLSRWVAEWDGPETTAVFTATVGVIVFGAIAPFHWTQPTTEDWYLLLLNGLLGAVGHYLLIHAFSLAAASTLQPFNYSLMLWAVFFGYVVFGDVPDLATLIGAAIVIAAGMYASEAGRLLIPASRASGDTPS